MATSSYSNHPEPVKEYKESIEIGRNAKYRRNPIAPALEVSRDLIAACDREYGHILKVLEDKIVCIRCEAEWKDEGF